MIRSVACLVLQIVLLATVAYPPARAQSEYTGERFPYAAFDRLPKTTLTIGGGTLDIGFAPGEFALPRSALTGWMETSAKAVSVYSAGSRSPRRES
jgi:hypothetical protein